MTNPYIFRVTAPDGTAEYLGPEGGDVWTREQAQANPWEGTEDDAQSELARRCAIWSAFQGCFVREPLAIAGKRKVPS